VFCDPKKKVKVASDFGHKTGGLEHGVNQVEIELKHVADFLKVISIFKFKLYATCTLPNIVTITNALNI
jgi:hypothetical protein